jgi:hypothetical protein
MKRDYGVASNWQIENRRNNERRKIMKHFATKVTYLSISVTLLIVLVPIAHANMEVTSVGIEMMQNFNGENTEYGYTIWGLIDEDFSHVILKGPDPDGAGELEAPVLADSRSDEFQTPAADNGFIFILWGGDAAPVVGDYTAEIYKTETGPPDYTKTIPVENRNIPTETVEITYPVPSTFYTVLPLGFTWNPYPYDEDETLRFRIAIFSHQSGQTVFEITSGNSDMGVYNGDPLPEGPYTLYVTANIFYTSDADPDFVYIKSGGRSVDFGMSYVSDLDQDGDVDGVDLSTFAVEYGLPD